MFKQKKKALKLLRNGKEQDYCFIAIKYEDVD